MHGISGVAIDTATYAGVKAVFAQCQGITTDDTIYTQFADSTAKSDVQTYLETHPQKIAAAITSGSGATGVMEGFQAAGKAMPEIANDSMEDGELAYWYQNKSSYKGVGITTTPPQLASATLTVVQALFAGQGREGVRDRAEHPAGHRRQRRPVVHVRSMTTSSTGNAGGPTSLNVLPADELSAVLGTRRVTDPLTLTHRTQTQAPPSTLLRIEGVTKAFGATIALRHCSLELRAGEVHALMGENGSGKSTLVKILSGVHRPDSGRVLIGSQPLRARSPRAATAAGVATVFQEVAVRARPVGPGQPLARHGRDAAPGRGSRAGPSGGERATGGADRAARRLPGRAAVRAGRVAVAERAPGRGHRPGAAAVAEGARSSTRPPRRSTWPPGTGCSRWCGG